MIPRCLPPLLILAFAVLPVSAQEVRGFVTEARGEQPLQGASVVLLRGADVAYGTTTDGDGFFRFVRVAPGSWRLRVSFVGFEPREEVLELTEGAVVSLGFALSEAAEGLDEVVVEAQAASGVAAVVAGLESIRPRDLARVPVPGAAGDLAAYLGTVPGVVQPGDRGGRYSIRGGQDDQNLVLLDGVPVHAAFHLLSMFSAFSDEIVDRASLHTAGFGAEFGGRLSSSLDVRTRNGNKQALSGSVAVAPFVSGARVEGPIVPGRASFLVSGRRSLLEDITPRLFGQEMPFRFGDAFVKVHALPARGQDLSAFVLFTDDTGQLAGSSFDFRGDPITEAPTDSLDLHWDNRVAGARWSATTGRVRTEWTAGRSRFTSRFGPAGSPERTSALESTDVEARFETDRFGAEWRAGASWHSVATDWRLDDAFRDSVVTDGVSWSESAAWVESEWTIGSFAFVPGVRLYSPGKGDGLFVEPRARISGRLSALGVSHRLSVAAARVHQAITGLTDERDVGNPFTVWTRVPAGGTLPRATHLVAGWGAAFAGADVAIEAWHKAIDGLQIPVFSVFPSFTTDLQPADGRARGLDARLATENRSIARGTTLDATVSWAWSRSEYETADANRFPAPNDRRHSVSGTLIARRGELSLTLTAQYGTGLPFTPSSGFDAWILLTPDTDVATDPARVRVLYGDPNSARQPVYARFDLWLERRVDRGRTVATIRAGAMNVLSRANLFYYDLFTYRRVNQLPLVPSVGIRLEVR